MQWAAVKKIRLLSTFCYQSDLKQLTQENGVASLKQKGELVLYRYLSPESLLNLSDLLARCTSARTRTCTPTFCTLLSNNRPYQ